MARTIIETIMHDLWKEERAAREEGYRCLVGIDEAGRGALAGPVVAACVVLPFECVPRGVNDSKLLSPVQREQLYGLIMAVARGVGVGLAEAATIDRINILRATHEAMRAALANLPPGLFPDLALIDGLPVHPFPVDQVALIQGDSRSASIAAASIIAKVTRDRVMRAYDADYPAYGFAGHKGYGAPIHLHALQEQGPCVLHRRSYRPVAEACARFPDRETAENRVVYQRTLAARKPPAPDASKRPVARQKQERK